MFSCSTEALGAFDDGACLCHRPEIRYLAHRIDTRFSRRSFIAGMAAAGASLSFKDGAIAQPRPAFSEPLRSILFTNVSLFDGRSPALRKNVQVRVEGNRIKSMSDGDAAPQAAETIDGGGRVLMPGLIDVHTHLSLATVPLQVALTADVHYLMLCAGRAADSFLMQGFTSVRDVGGPVFGLKRAIDEGVIAGPRIWPAGAMLSQTSGHGDFRTLHDLPRQNSDPLHFTERLGAAALADGVDEVLRRTREQLMLGASHIKVMAGGGVTSDHDPLDSSQYTEAELHAAVEAADDWNTYVTVHAYTPAAIQKSLRAGVKCIEHGHLADEKTAQLMAEKGIWWSLQPFLDDEDATPFPEGSSQRVHQKQVIQGTDNAYRLAKAHRVKTAFGTDTLFNARVARRQGAQLAKLTRWHSPAEVLKMATADNGELLALSGPRNPYPGKIGVIEDNALADLLVVDGDPLTDIALIANPEKNFRIIMKDGKIHKNTLST
jgi:imidazolonepropionase-like amidohydrolase